MRRSPRRSSRSRRRARSSSCPTTSSRRSCRPARCVDRRRPRGGRGLPRPRPATASRRRRAAGPPRAPRPRRDPGRRAQPGRRALARRPAAAGTLRSSASRSSRDKDADAMLRRARPAGRHARRHAVDERPCAAGCRARRPGPAVSSRTWRRSPTRDGALARAHELGGPVLVTGSLYLLADLAARDALAWRG